MVPDARSEDDYPSHPRSRSVVLEQKPSGARAAGSGDAPISPSDADTTTVDNDHPRHSRPRSVALLDADTVASDDGSRSSSICSSSSLVDSPFVKRPKKSSLVATSSSSDASTLTTRCVTRSQSPARVDIRLQKRIGTGTFGTVYEGKMDGESVAVKRVVLDPTYFNRELEIMQLLVNTPHPNIVALKHSHVEQTGGAMHCFFVMPMYPMSLGELIHHWSQIKRSSEWKTKLYTYQLARALAHLHGLGICHRDLKPQNVLVNPSSGELVLCDFGSSKVMGQAKNTTYIASRFYRAPECILENASYTTAIDIWALGCIVAEMVSLRPLFDGMDSTDQLYLIFKARGTPSFEDFTQLNPGLETAVIEQLQAQPRPARKWSVLLKTNRLSQSYTALLDKLLRWSPTARPEARHVLGDAYFDKLRGLSDAQRELIGPKLFDFSDEELRGPPGPRTHTSGNTCFR